MTQLTKSEGSKRKTTKLNKAINLIGKTNTSTDYQIGKIVTIWRTLKRFLTVLKNILMLRLIKVC